MRPDSLMICFTHGGKVDADFMRSVLIFQRYDWRNRNILHEPAMLDVSGDYMACRNIVPREFLKHDCAWMLFVDTDHRFPPDAIYKLLDAADPAERPIVSSLFFTYIAEWPHPVPEWFEKLPSGMYRTVSQFGPGLQKIDAFGMGFHIVHRTALEKMYEAHKDDEWSWYGRELIYTDVSTEADHHFGLDFIEPARLGDDLSFGLRCERLGIPIYGHGGVRIDHNKARRENVETWEIGNDEKVVARTHQLLAAKKAQEAKFYAALEGEGARNGKQKYQRASSEREVSAKAGDSNSAKSSTQVWCPYPEEGT